MSTREELVKTARAVADALECVGNTIFIVSRR